MYHTQKFKQVTLLNLIDFEGNELLSDNKDLDQLRFSTLKRLLFEHPCEDLCILSENLDEKPHATRTLELYEEVKDRYDWQWLEWDNKYRNGDPNSIKEIKK